MLKARYDPRADRMLLTLQPAQGDVQSYWLTRRQWLGWLHALLALPQPQVAAAKELASTQKVAPPAPRPRLDVGEVGEPKSCKAIRLRRSGKMVQVVIVADSSEAGGTLTVTLGAEGVRQLREMLEQQAERAGWDTGAALARLSAAALANAAVGKARRAQ